MSSFTIYQDNYADTTIVPNLFIDEYMTDANDAQLKVYLYLLRMMGAHKATSVSDIADQFNHTEKDVMRALKYWEKKGLLALQYDDVKSLSGIRLIDVMSRPCSEVVPVTSAVAKETLSTEKESSDLAPVATNAYEKPAYSLDDLKAFKEKEETGQILFVAEQYLGKPLTPTEIKTILFFSDKLGFSTDLIDYLIQYCVERGKKSFRYIEKVAIAWAEEGITSPKQAASSAYKYEKIVYDIMNALGKSSAPTRTEADFVMKWTKEYGFESDMILEACRRTTLATDKHRFEYADGILKNWYQNRIKHKNDIKLADENYSKRKNSRAATQSSSSNQFNQFMHNDYDFASLEKELLSN